MKKLVGILILAVVLIGGGLKVACAYDGVHPEIGFVSDFRLEAEYGITFGASINNPNIYIRGDALYGTYTFSGLSDPGTVAVRSGDAGTYWQLNENWDFRVGAGLKYEHYRRMQSSGIVSNEYITRPTIIFGPVAKIPLSSSANFTLAAYFVLDILPDDERIIGNAMVPITIGLQF